MMHYLQSSGIFGSLAILVGFFSAIAGILILFLSRSRRLHFLSVVAGGLPIVVGAAGSLVGYLRTRESTLRMYASDPTVIREWHLELISPMIVGAMIAIPLLIFLGVIFVIRSKQIKQTDNQEAEQATDGVAEEAV
jgi:hypothetical protein